MHWFPVYDLGNECALVFSTREGCSGYKPATLLKMNFTSIFWEF